MNARLVLVDLYGTISKIERISLSTMIDPDNIYAKDHLKYRCRMVPSTPLRPGYNPSSLARRIALKKLTKSRSSVSNRKGIG